MSSICAVWRKANPTRVTDDVRAVMARLCSNPGERALIESIGASGIAVAAQGRHQGQDCFHDGGVLLACDADLLNEAELRRAVPSAQRSVGALLAALYRKDGARFVEALRGGFSFVLWDGAERRLFSAIDGFGIKRLVWYESDDVLLIATRADAVLGAVPDLSINPRAIANVLNFSANLAPETIFRGVRRLTPGTLLTSSGGPTSTQPYWDMRYESVDTDERTLGQELESVVEASVRAQCNGSLAPHLGAFLSGGTDSSTVVGLATRVLGKPVKAFSIGFEEPGFSELEFADIAARAFGAEHYKYSVTAKDCVEALPHIVRSFDEPFGNSSAIPTYFCTRLAAQHGVTTLLAGDGGDELFGGNERYATDKIFEVYFTLPGWLRASIEPVAAYTPGPLGGKARRYLRRAKMRGVERMLSFQFLQTHAPEDVFDTAFLQSLGSYDVTDIPARHYAAAPARAHLDRLLYVDVKITLADNDLPKVTCMAELADVRTRFPFLDRSVAEFSGRVPPHLKVKGFKKRYLFKKAFGDLLPQQVIQKKKHGFGIPVALWMKTDPKMREMSRDTLLSGRALGRGYFRKGFVEELFRSNDTTPGTYYGDILWTFLMIELWHRQVVDASGQALS